MPGDYELSVRCEYDDSTREEVKRTLTITPARVPWRNTQICTWNESSDNYAALGVTIGGMSSLKPLLVDENTRRGLYSEYNWVFMGNFRPGVENDRAMDYQGKRTYASILSPYVRESVIAEAENMADELKYLPSVKMLIMNTERHAGSTSFDYSPETIAMLKEKFGVDLALWRDSKLPVWRRFQPLGWLNADTPPADGIVRDDDPLYRMHRWWHGPEGASDVVLNDLLAAGVNRRYPEILTAKEPILRRPALRSYRDVRVAEDWVYYPDMSTMVRGVEMNQAQTRGCPDMVASTMPQFLLKPGMAAPFSAMPTADMLREAVWLVCSRPARLMTFWNARNAFAKGDQKTAAEIREVPESALKNVKAWAPGLAEEFKDLSNRLWRPFGALLPQWRNAPRRVAVVYSFVSHLYGNQRWPNGGWLMNALAASGVPYDVLLDNDLEASDFPSQYDLIVLPHVPYLTGSMVNNLKKAQAAGCKLVSDGTCKFTLPGMINLTKPTNQLNISEKELALLKLYDNKTDSPQFVEAMEQLAGEQNPQALPELDRLLSELPRMPVICLSKQVYWNLLEADGAAYLVAVNDRRIPGELYGRFGKVREKGIPHTAEFKFRDKWQYAWDLTANQAVEIKDTLKLELPPCGGRIIMLSTRPLGKLSIKGNAKVACGKANDINIQMPSSGLTPVEIKLLEPSGRENSLSHFSVLKQGKLNWQLPIPYNAPTGQWQLKVREACTGTESTFKFTVQ